MTITISSHVETTILRQPVCPECGALGPLKDQTEEAAEAVCTEHDDIWHTDGAPNGYDA